MRTSMLKIFWIALAFLPRLALGGQAAGSSIAGFDLFTFPISAVDQGLGKRFESLGKALSSALPKNFQGKDFPTNNYGGRCLVGGADQYELEWMDSETEGFRFTVRRLKSQAPCKSPFNETETFKSAALDSAKFFPICRSHPSLQLGVTTPDQIKKEFGAPAYSSSEQLIYVLKRDQGKEKGCGYQTNHGDFAAIEVQFHFADGVLQSVTMNDSIAGEC